jgi:hypothetical protein
MDNESRIAYDILKCSYTDICSLAEVSPPHTGGVKKPHRAAPLYPSRRENFAVGPPRYIQNLGMILKHTEVTLGIADKEIVESKERHGCSCVVVNIGAYQYIQRLTSQNHFPIALLIEQHHIKLVFCYPVAEIPPMHSRHVAYTLTPSDVIAVPVRIADGVSLAATGIDEHTVLR